MGKKIVSMILILLLLFCQVSISASAYDNGIISVSSFKDLLDWNGIVFNNVDNIIDCEGTVAVGNNFMSTRGFSVNSGAYGKNPASTDDITFLVNNNININGYGNVYGQTAVGNTNNNTYHLTNVTNSGTTNGVYTTTNANSFFSNAKDIVSDISSLASSLPVNGVYKVENNIYTFEGNENATTVVYNINEANFNSYLFDFSIAENQTIVINLTSSEKIIFKNGGFKINGSSDPDILRTYNRNLIFNVSNATDIEMTSCELYGCLLAFNSTLSGNNANICGTSILNNLIGLNGFELHVGYNNSFIPVIGESSKEEQIKTIDIRIDTPLKMAIIFEDNSVYYNGQVRKFVFNKEYRFQICTVNWSNGIFNDDNGLRGTVVYRMEIVRNNSFKELVKAAKEDPERYTVKGIDIIDNMNKKIIINGDSQDVHLETDVNNFFVAYRFHFSGEDYNKKTQIENVVNTPVESLSVNLPVGSTVICNAYVNGEKVSMDKLFITTNSGTGIYEDEFLTSVNDYTWNY